MSFQFQRKGIWNFSVYQTEGIAFLAGICVLVIYGVHKKATYPLLLWFGIPLWMSYLIGREMWYQPLFGIGLLLTFAGIFPLIILLFHSLFSSVQKTFALILFTIVATGVFVYAVGTFGGSRAFDLRRMRDIFTNEWEAMHMQSSFQPYIEDGDISAVMNYLHSLRSSPSPIYVQFSPVADALFFTDAESPDCSFYQGTFHTFMPDVYIIHVSRYLYPWWKNDIEQNLPAIGAPLGDTVHLLSTRDSTERYYYCVSTIHPDKR